MQDDVIYKKILIIVTWVFLIYYWLNWIVWSYWLKNNLNKTEVTIKEKNIERSWYSYKVDYTCGKDKYKWIVLIENVEKELKINDKEEAYCKWDIVMLRPNDTLYQSIMVTIIWIGFILWTKLINNN